MRKTGILAAVLALLLWGCGGSQPEPPAVSVTETAESTVAVAEAEIPETTASAEPAPETTESTWPNYFEENNVVLFDDMRLKNERVRYTDADGNITHKVDCFICRYWNKTPRYFGLYRIPRDGSDFQAELVLVENSQEGMHYAELTRFKPEYVRRGSENEVLMDELQVSRSTISENLSPEQRQKFRSLEGYKLYNIVYCTEIYEDNCAEIVIPKLDQAYYESIPLPPTHIYYNNTNFSEFFVFQDRTFCMIDTNTGTVIRPTSLPYTYSEAALEKSWHDGTLYVGPWNNGIVYTYPIVMDGVEQTVYVCYYEELVPVRRDEEKLNGVSAKCRMSVLVPDGYDGILFAQSLNDQNLMAKEEVLDLVSDTETSDRWWVGSMQEYLEFTADKHITYYGFEDEYPQ